MINYKWTLNINLLILKPSQRIRVRLHTRNQNSKQTTEAITNNRNTRVASTSIAKEKVETV